MESTWLRVSAALGGVSVAVEVLGKLSPEVQVVLIEFNQAFYDATAQLNTKALAETYFGYLAAGPSAASGLQAFFLFVFRVFGGFGVVLVAAYSQGALCLLLQLLALGCAIPLVYSWCAAWLSTPENSPTKAGQWAIFGVLTFLMASGIMMFVQAMLIATSTLFGWALAVATTPLALAVLAALKWLVDRRTQTE